MPATATLKGRLEGLYARQKEIVTEVEALGETDPNDAGYKTALETIDALNKEFDGNEKEIDTLSAAQQRARAARDRMVQDITPPGAGVGGDDVGVPGIGSVKEGLEAWDKIRLPARARFHKSKVFQKDEDAYFSGLSIMAMCGNAWAHQKLVDCGYRLQRSNEPVTPMNAMEGGTPSAGGYTVPVPLAAEIIRLVEEFGVFRRYSRNMPMTSATLDVPKRAAGLTVYYPGEGNAITPSDITFGQVNLVAKKYAQLAIWSTELDEDSIISMTDLVTREMAWGYAQAEDTNSFLGDGSAPFGGITGIKSALQAGCKVTGAASWGGITLAMYHAMIGKLQWYPGIQPVWFINHQGWAESMQALAYAAGGNTVLSVSGGMQEAFLGYPVVKTQVLNRDPSTSSEMVCVFGDLRLGSMLGTRRDMTMQILRELYAASDQIGLVSTMRSDTQIHDVGDASTCGCISMLETPV